jgi:hypothetical protein
VHCTTTHTDSNTPVPVEKARESVSDLAAALNAIIIESGFDDQTRAGLMAALDAASGSIEPFQKADKYLGRRMARNSSVAIEHADEVGDRALAKRFQRAWTLIDAEQERTGLSFVIRRRGGLRGENRETMERHPSTYTVPLVQIVVDVIRRARQFRAEYGKNRETMFQRAAREVLVTCPRDYEPEGKPFPVEKRKLTEQEKQAQIAAATVTRIFNSHDRIVKRAALEPHLSARGACLTMMRQLRDAYGAEFDEALREFLPDHERNNDTTGVYYSVSGNVLHADEPEFPTLDLADEPAAMPEFFENLEGEARGHELFQKLNKNAGENESYVPPACIVGGFCDSEIDPVEVAEAAAIQAESCVMLTEPPNVSEPLNGLTREFNIADEAMHLACALGWKIFPLHTPDGRGGCSCRKSDCQNTGKHPRTPRGLKDATNDPEQVGAWWLKYPDANIGIATGDASGFLVFDVDPRHGGWEGLQSLFERIGEPFPATVEQITGSDGRHFLFRMPDVDIRNSAGKLGKGLDVRANGGYIVAAPSLHASGNRYRWTAEVSDLADLPYTLLRELTDPVRAKDKAHRTNSATAITWTSGTIPEGSRHDFLVKGVACSLRGRGFGEDEILDALFEARDKRCATGIKPVSDAELYKIAASVMKYAPGMRAIV